MTAEAARERVKEFLDIPTATTDFDSSIDGFVTNGVNRLYPYVQNEVAPQSVTSFTLYSGRAELDLSALSTPLTDVRILEIDDGSTYFEHDKFLVHGSTLLINDIDTDINTLRLFGLARHTVTSLEVEFELPVVYFAVSDFYNMLMGNKRKYNIYMQSTGARGVDNMQDIAQHFEDLANAYLNDRATLYGRS